MADRKTKLLFISDHPLIPSGVGTQAKYLIEGLLETGKYTFQCFGGAIKHPDYRPTRVAPEKFGDDWTIFPVDGHGSKEMLRTFLAYERPDCVIIFTDPRFFFWVWEMEDEIRQVCPLLYWHVWDNDPPPKFNKVFYDSTDFISCLSLKTYGLLQALDVDPEKFNYIPHALPDELFKPLPEEETTKFRRQYLGPHADKKHIVFWNNRNARRKQTGDVVESFALFAKEVGKENVALFMHTQADDPEGQNIHALAEQFGVQQNLIMSEERIDPAILNHYYNACDTTINIASNEGFGLGTLESLFAGTPIVVHMTGGLQFQIGDWWQGLKDFSSQEKMTKGAKERWDRKTCEWWGVPVFTKVRNCTGSQPVPYIYDDKADNHEVAKALVRLYKMGRQARKELGARARQWATANFSLKSMVDSWDSTIGSTVERFRDSTRQRYHVQVA